MSRLLQPFERMLDALTDPARRERAVVWLLTAYCATWALYGVLAKGSQDVHFDMGEMPMLGRAVGFSPGTPKHPPLGAWLASAWFAIFPQQDWAFYLFAMVLTTFAVWVAWRVSEGYLHGEKRVAGLLLLTFIPFFNFHSLKYNANTVLIPLWAIATWFFVRSYETRSALWAALAGLGAAAAMMGKYWSIFLLAGLGVAALADARRAEYFRSSAPWITVGVGALLFGPHIVWLVAHDFAPFSYAVTGHHGTLAASALSGLGFLVGVAAYIAAPVAVAALMTRPSTPTIVDAVWPHEPKRRFAFIAFVAPLILPAIAAVLAEVQIVSLWAMCAMTLLPVVLFSSPLLTVTRRATSWLLAAAIVFPVLMVLAAPFIAVWIHREGVPNYATHYRLLAQAVDRIWHANVNAPLRFIGSYTNIVNGVSFYLPDRPITLDIVDPPSTPWADDASVARAGIALVCPEPEAICMHFLNQRAGNLPRHAVTLSREHWGVRDKPVRYIIVVVPPAK
jgi:4-amino-4-deoxy-L-arabinose transferase-like glycosyltransferase